MNESNKLPSRTSEDFVSTWNKTLRRVITTILLTGTLPALAQDDPEVAPEATPEEAAPSEEAPAETPAEATGADAAPKEAAESAESSDAKTPTRLEVPPPTGPAPAGPASTDPVGAAGAAGAAEASAPAGAEAGATTAPPEVSTGAPSAPTRVALDLPPPPSLADDLPIPTLTIDRVPPNTSFEFAIQVSYGTVAYFRDQVPPWVGFGLRAGWGKNFGLHRFGIAGTVSAEGDIGVHTQLAVEPTAAWDFVSRQGLLFGAGVGPAVVYTARTSTVRPEYGLDIAPSVAARIGWSQTWSRVGRRLFLFAEPKVRFAAGKVSPVVAIAVGSGAGR